MVSGWQSHSRIPRLLQGTSSYPKLHHSSLAPSCFNVHLTMEWTDPSTSSDRLAATGQYTKTNTRRGQPGLAASTVLNLFPATTFHRLLTPRSLYLLVSGRISGAEWRRLVSGAPGVNTQEPPVNIPLLEKPYTPLQRFCHLFGEFCCHHFTPVDAVRTRSKLALEVVFLIMVSRLANLEYAVADLCISLIDIVLPKFGFEDVAGLGANKAFLI